MELISVIVPVYNCDKYIERCIKSIVGQTYQNIELIIVDDGSSDNTSSICEFWAGRDPRIKVLHQKNQGVGTSRNNGVRLSSGEYIIMADSDDYLAPDMIELLIHMVKKHNTQMAICGFVKGHQNDYHFSKLDKGDPEEVISAEEALLRAYDNPESALQYIAPWGKIYHRSLFDGIDYPTNKIFEDIYVTHRLICKSGHIAVTSEAKVYYFQHPESIMNKEFHIGKLDYLEALRQRIEYFQSNKLEKLASIAYDEYLHSLIWEYSRARDILKNKNVVKQISSDFRAAYRLFYSGKRYPEESAWFLLLFYINPELIIFYWKIRAKLRRVLR